VKIKFNHIQDLADARYAASCMADYMGFAISGEHALPLAQIQEIIGWCSGPKLCLETAPETTLESIQAYCDVLPIEAIACSLEQAQRWSQLLADDLEYLISDSQSVEAPFWAGPIKITQFDAEFALSLDPHSFISLDCVAQAQVGLKNFDEWNSFFEALDIL